MPQNDHPLINGVYHSSAEVTLTLAPYGGGIFRTPDFTALDFTEKLEPGQVKKLGGAKRGTTEGEYSAEGSMEMLLAAHMAFVADLGRVARAKRIKLGAVQFSMAASWRSVPGSPLVRVALVGVRIKERGFNAGPDASASVVSTPLDVTILRTNGLSLGEIPK